MRRFVNLGLALLVSAGLWSDAVAAQATACASWCCAGALTTSEVIDFTFVKSDAYYVVAAVGTVKVYSSDSRALRSTRTAPTGQHFRGLKVSSNGQYVFAFTEKSVSRLDVESLAWVDATPHTFSTLWDGEPAANIFDLPVNGGIFDVAPSSDGAYFVAVTREENGTATARKVLVADKSVQLELPSDFYPGDVTAYASILASGKLLQIGHYAGPMTGGDSVLWDLENPDNTECLYIAGHSAQWLSASQVGLLTWDGARYTQLYLVNPANIVAGGGCTDVSSTVIPLHYADLAVFGPSGLVKLPTGSIYTVDTARNHVVKVNTSTGVVTKAAATTISTSGLDRNNAGSVIVAYGSGGAQAIYLGAAVPAPTNFSVARRATNSFTLTWSLVNLNPALTVSDYVVDFRRDSNGNVTRIADGRSTGLSVVASAANPGKFRVKAVFTNGSSSAWSAWVRRP